MKSPLPLSTLPWLDAPLDSTLMLNREANIIAISAEALELMEYGVQQSLFPCFFSHVHGKSLHSVMRDISQMVFNSRPYADWLLGLRRGTGRWGWYRAMAYNQLHTSEATILIYLRTI